MTNIDEKIQTLKQILPEVFNSWKHPYQAFFHLTENIAGQIDGTPLNIDQIPSLYTKRITLYDHTYGCPTRCIYCGYFTKSPPDNKDTLEKHIELKGKESEIILNRLPGSEVSSMYFGGGTPTILPPYLLERLIKSYSKFNLSKDSEVTVEAHPKTIRPDKLEILASNGINRVSIGIQSLNPEILKDCNRKYSPDEALKAIRLAKDYIPIVNVDLIYGLRNQTIEDHLDTLKRISDLGVDQITAYAMWLKKGSVVDREFSRSQTQDYPSPIKRAKMYLLTKLFLEEQGYEETLLGWFSKPGKEVRIYPQRWEEQVPCIGIGAGAYSYGEDWHYNNVQNWQEYEERVSKGQLSIETGWKFGAKEKILAQLMWKIKTGKDFKINSQEEQLLRPYINKGLIEEIDNETLRVSELGKPVHEWMIGNLIENSK